MLIFCDKKEREIFVVAIQKQNCRTNARTSRKSHADITVALKCKSYKTIAQNLTLFNIYQKLSQNNTLTISHNAVNNYKRQHSFKTSLPLSVVKKYIYNEKSVNNISKLIQFKVFSKT